MKNFLRNLFLAALFMGGFSLEATHIMGGEITWSCTPSGQYIFRMKLYRDCQGISAPSSAILRAFNYPTTGGQATFPMSRVSQTDISPDCNVPNSPGATELSCFNFGGSQGNGAGAVEESVYQTAPVTLNGTPPANGWVFTWSSCCRNNTVDNINNPSGTGHTLRAIMYPFTPPGGTGPRNANPCYDNSPVFEENANTVICTGYPFTYNHNATDAELDSLFYSWADPLSTIGSGWNPPASPPTVNWLSGYSSTSPLPGTAQNPSNVPASIDGPTGQISYTSYTQGSYVTCIKVEAWKCGQLVAEIFRDIQVTLINCGAVNNPPTLLITPAPGSVPINVNGTIITATAYAGDLVAFSLNATDFDFQPQSFAPQEIEFSATGNNLAPIGNPGGGCLNPPCANITPTPGQPTFVNPTNNQVEFSWNTDCNHLNTQNGCGTFRNSYSFALRMEDDFCPAPAISIATLKVTVVADPSDPPQMGCVGYDPSGGINVTWTAPVDTGFRFDKYIIYFKPANTPGAVFSAVDSNSNYAATSALLNGLPNNGDGEYFMRVRGMCGYLSVPSDTSGIIASGPGTGCIVCDQYAAGDTFSLDSGATWYTVVDRPLLETMRDNGDDLSKVCVSLVNNMSALFKNKHSFNDNISSWDVSNVTNFAEMFRDALQFNQDLGQWDVSSALNMQEMFAGASNFNHDLTSWCVTNIPTPPIAFSYNSPLSNSHIPIWGTCNENPNNAYINQRGCVVCDQYAVADSFSLDSGASWYTVVDRALLNNKRNNNADLSRLCVSLVDNMSQLFLSNASFNQDISGWDVSNVTDMTVMFGFATAFNQDIGNWDVGNVTDMSLMFYSASSFDQDLSGWCVPSITSLPVDFATISALSATNYPNWGSCPCPLTLDLGLDSVSVCDSSYVLDAGHGYSSYLWSTGDTTQSIQVDTTGNYSCTVSDGYCSASDSIYVSLLYAPISASNGLFCAGDLVTLTAGILPDIVISQLGQDIDGEAADDRSGSSVSLSADGQTVAIGAPFNDDNGFFAGHVRVYSFNGLSWSQIGQDIDGEAADDRSGSSVSLSADGQTAAIGAIGNDGNGNYAGHVRVYSFNGSSWNQVGQDIDGEAVDDRSGYSISLSADGQTVAIGAQSNDGNGFDAGHVRVYSFNGSSWSQVGQDIDGEAARDNSGTSVSLSSDGQTVAIGAYGNDGNGSIAGHVRVYSFNGSSWIKLGQDIDGEAADDRSGSSVSLSADGQTVAIGAYGNGGNGSNPGHVRVYSFNGSTWTQVGQDIDGEAADDLSGFSVSLSADGQTVAIGAQSNDGNGNDAGHVRIYSFNGSTWNQLGQDIDGESANDYFGRSVSLSADGQTVAIGALSNDGNGTEAGHVRVFSIPSNSSGAALNFSWSTGDTTQSISVSPTQPTTYFCTVSDGNSSCMDSIFIDMPISVDSILALDANKGVYKAYFSGLDPALSYDLQFKSVSDTLWRSKAIRVVSSGQQKFNVVPLYSDSIDVRIIEVAGEEGCISSLVTPCKNMNLQLVEQKSAFCAGDSALVRVGIAGGYGAKSILWSNGATTKRTYAQQGETLTVTVTDASGCSLTDSITASTLSTATAPTGLTITRFGAIISAQWNASNLSSNQTLLGYKLNFRLRNTQTWTKSALISGTSTVLNWTGSGIPAGNYEFVVFARYRENGVAMNSNFSCITVKGYNGVGGKSDISDASDNSHGPVPTLVYPNPADDFLYVQAALGSELRLLDMQGKMITQMISTELETALDLSALAQGVYMLEIHSVNGTTTERVVKQ